VQLEEIKLKLWHQIEPLDYIGKMESYLAQKRGKRQRMDLQQHHVVDHKSHIFSATIESRTSRWGTDNVS
jgi:hypothetical protein